MNPAIRLDVGELLDVLDALRRARDVCPLLDDAVDAALDLERSVFRTAGASIGAPWAPLHPDTVRQKRAAGATTPGVFTGVLEASLTRRGARYSVVDRGRDRVAIGTSAPHAGVFAGASRRQPARAIEPTQRQLEDVWLPLVDAHLDGAGGVFDGVLG